MIDRHAVWETFDNRGRVCGTSIASRRQGGFHTRSEQRAAPVVPCDVDQRGACPRCSVNRYNRAAPGCRPIHGGRPFRVARPVDQGCEPLQSAFTKSCWAGASRTPQRSDRPYVLAASRWDAGRGDCRRQRERRLPRPQWLSYMAVADVDKAVDAGPVPMAGRSSSNL